MSRGLRYGIWALGIVVSFSAGLYGQPVIMPACSPESPFFCVDAASFLEGDAQIAEIYIEVCNDALQFVKTQDEYRASADVTVVLLDNSGKQVTGDTFRVNLTSSRYEETTSIDTCSTLHMSFRANAGRYLMAVTLTDRDSRRRSIVQASYTVPDFSGSPTLSDMSFIASTKETGGSRWPGFEANVRRSYGDIGEGIRFYYEIYNAVQDSLTVTYRVLDAEGAEAIFEAEHMAAAGEPGQFGRVPLETLPNGQYTLEVALLDGDGDVAVSRSRGFEVNREEFYLARDVKDAVDLLAYIATSSFIDSFVEADIEERRRLWEQFWREKDPTPATPRNEFYEEHLKRFRYANVHFTAGLTEGWRTDRGRIYIVEGPPDEVDSYSMEIDRQPTEIWFYFENGRRYVFVDETGFGDYVLVSIR